MGVKYFLVFAVFAVAVAFGVSHAFGGWEEPQDEEDTPFLLEGTMSPTTAPAEETTIFQPRKGRTFRLVVTTPDQDIQLTSVEMVRDR